MIEHIQAAWQPVGKCWVLAVWPFDKHLAGEKLGHSKSRANLIHGKCQKICPSMIFHFHFYAKMCDLRQLKNTQPLARSVHFPCLENLPAQAEAPRQNRGTLNTVSHHTHSAHTEVHTGLFRNMLHQKKEDLKKM